MRLTAWSARAAPEVSRGLEEFDQLALRAAGLVSRMTPWVVAAVCVHIPGLHVVSGVDFQPFDDDATLEFLVEHREGKLDAAEEIAFHPVSTGEIDLFFAICIEVEHAMMLQQSADD